MSDTRIQDLVDALRSGTIDRRTFMVRAVALGLSVGTVMRTMDVVAQSASPSPAESGGALGPDTVGAAGVAHGTDTSKGEIHIYSSFPMTASYEELGGDAKLAIEYAIELWGGAAGGHKIVYTALDDGIASNNGGWDGAKEAENATKAVNDKDAMVYIGTYNSGAAEVSIPITNKAGMAQISAANTAVKLTKKSEGDDGYPDVLYPSGKRNYMRICPSDDLQGSAGANYAYNTVGRRKVFILHDNQTYGKGLATVYDATWKQLGGEVLGFEAYDAKADSYSALMERIASLGPDIVYCAAIVSQNTSKVIKDMRDVMSPDDVSFMGPDGLINDAFVKEAGDAAEGGLLTFGGLPTTALKGTGKTWADAMEAKLGRPADSYAAYHFEAAVCALQAIEQGGKDRAKVLDAAFQTKDFRGLTNTWSFTETGDPNTTTMTVNKITDGKITFESTITPPQ